MINLIVLSHFFFETLKNNNHAYVENSSKAAVNICFSRKVNGFLFSTIQSK